MRVGRGRAAEDMSMDFRVFGRGFGVHSKLAVGVGDAQGGG